MQASNDYYLIVDTETAGLPQNWKAPISDSRNWPRMVQLAWSMYDGRGQRIESKSFIIRPEGFTIPATAAAVHGITTERALIEGVSLSSVLEAFVECLHQSQMIVAHNINFDAKIIGAELFRLNSPVQLMAKPQVCTMQASTNYCKIPGRYGYKWPTLTELHDVLFATGFEGAHDAMNDVNACAKCFFALKERGVFAVA